MLLKKLPANVAQVLISQKIEEKDLVLCTDTDIDRLGRYRRQWLAVTPERLVVVEEGEPAGVVVGARFDEVNEFRCEPVVGSGLLQARIGTIYFDLLRYSNRMADRFAKVSRKLQLRVENEPIVITPEDNQEKEREGPLTINRGVVLRRIWELLKPYGGPATLMISLMLVGIGLDLVMPLLTQYLIDNVLPGTKENAQQWQAIPEKLSQHRFLLLEVVGILAAVQIIRMGVGITIGRVGVKVGTAVTSDMRNRLVAHLQQLSVGYYDRQQVGSLVGRVAYDTEALHDVVHQLTAGFLFQLVMLVGVTIMMFVINTQLALWTLLPAPLVATGSIVFWKYVYPRNFRFWDASSKQAGMLSGMLSGIRVVKAFAQEDLEQKRFEKASHNLRDARRNVGLAAVTFYPIMTLLFQLGGWIVWYVGGNNVLDAKMTLGQLIAFFGFLWMFYGPLGSLTQLTQWLTNVATQMHRIFEILDTPPQIKDVAKPVRIDTIQGRIAFKRVSFGYDRQAQVLRDVTFEIQPGEMIGVVGRSGSGKSTLVNLLCRFYDVNDGQVLIDNVDVRQLGKDNLRTQIGVVLQEPFLFRGSIWENLIYGKRNATPQEVIQAAKAGNCHDFISKTAHGYDTWVGERGAGLSGGERQRVSIARVLLSDPRILILDEATSSVDAESEASIQAALAEVVKGRTTIAIAHRLSTLRNAHRIMVVDAGKIAEVGSHDELMSKGGLYARLVNMQGMAKPPTIDEMAAQEALKAAGSGRSFDHRTDQHPSTAPTDKTDPADKQPPSHHPRWLTPDNALIHLGGRGALHVTVLNDRIYSGAFALRCFPVQYPQEFISLRYLNQEKREVEVGLVAKMSDWPDEVQDLLRSSLLKRYLVHTIRAVTQITVMHGGFLNFEVDTDLGPMQFYMRYQGDRAQDYGKGGKLLLDIDENRYLVPNIDELPERDRRLFTRYIYW
ncbi:MAG: DUF1854 domain-containing protein [Phycisphaeraceae bacterium]|nr:DUF1854 domain-containing protein [Phycisphaeraceae bacterium]